MKIQSFLSSELIQLILEHINDRPTLHGCALVNSQFYTLAIPKLWHSPYGLSNSQTIMDRLLLNGLHMGILHSQRTLGHHIRKLEFDNWTPVAIVIDIVTLAPLLEDLRLIHTEITDQDMERVAHGCPYLFNLKIALSPITDRSMEFLSQHCRQLHSLYLNQCEGLTADALLPLKDSQLKRLKLREYDCFTAENTGAHIIHLTQLTSLDLAESFIDDTYGLVKQLVPQPTKNNMVLLPLLTRFYITGIDSAHDLWMQFIQSHPLLEELCLQFCELDDSDLAILSTSLPSLHHLNLQGNSKISSRVLRQVVKDCPRLTFVNLTDCELPRRCFPELDGPGKMMLSISLKEIKRIRLNLDFDIKISDDELTPSEVESVNEYRYWPRTNAWD